MNLADYFNNGNLHHAYLIEGKKDSVMSEIIEYIRTLGIKIERNPDFQMIHFDSLKIDDARNLKALGVEKSLEGNKKIFVISANNFLLEAQNTLLKIFEEPIANTHFFVVVPDSSVIIPTLLSRFYVIKYNEPFSGDMSEATTFLALNLRDRLSFLKEYLSKNEENGLDKENSPKVAALDLLNQIETVVYSKFYTKERAKSCEYIKHIFKVREYLNVPGSSHKTLMESIAISVPVIK